MNDAVHHVLSHWDDGLAYAALLWIAQAFIGTMPPPQPMERWYGWAYGFLQAEGPAEVKCHPVDINALQQQGPAWVALVALAGFAWKGAWPYYKRVNEQSRADRRADLAECAEERRKNLEERRQDLDRFMLAMERRDSGFGEVVKELAYLSEIIIESHDGVRRPKPKLKTKRK